MKNILKITINYILAVGMVLLLNGCRKNVDHLSEIEKSYLIYNPGDTIRLTNKNNTLYGYVTEKEFEIISQPDLFGVRHEYEKGILRIGLLDDLSYMIAHFELYNEGSSVNASYIFSIDTLIEKNNNCYGNDIYFNALLKSGEFAEYSQDKKSYIKLEPIDTDTYELLSYDQYTYENQFQLQINKSKGSLLIYNESDSVFITKK